MSKFVNIFFVKSIWFFKILFKKEAPHFAKLLDFIIRRRPYKRR